MYKSFRGDKARSTNAALTNCMCKMCSCLALTATCNAGM